MRILKEKFLRRQLRVLALAIFVSGFGSCASDQAAQPALNAGSALNKDVPMLVQGKSSSAGLHYVLTLPGAVAGGSHPPLIVFLHSLEERGGPLDLLMDNPKGQGLGLAGYAYGKPGFPFATLSPLCPKGGFWTFMHRRLVTLIMEVVAEYGLDPGRVFLSGVSMGGIATWSLGMYRPGLFKALAPIAGPVYTPPIRPRYSRLAGLPVFAFHDRSDPSIAFALAEASVEKLNSRGGSGKLTAYDTGLHYIQEQVFYDGELFERFLALAAGGPVE
ncbi:MAG TPA: hypothetical protein DCG47_07985 [Spirochaetaceae bacterium]|nr:hypothetical protein [Spirochaetaceae bacterium]